MSFVDIWRRITASRDDQNVPDHGKDQLTFAVLAIHDAMTRLTEAEVYTEPYDPNIATYRTQLKAVSEAIMGNYTVVPEGKVQMNVDPDARDALRQLLLYGPGYEGTGCGYSEFIRRAVAAAKEGRL